MAEARVRVTGALTDLCIACERLADTAKVRAGVVVFFTEHALQTQSSAAARCPGETIEALGLKEKDEAGQTSQNAMTLR